MAQNAQERASKRLRNLTGPGGKTLTEHSSAERAQILAALADNSADEREPLPTDGQYRRAEVTAALDNAGPELDAFRKQWRPLRGLDDLAEVAPLRMLVLDDYPRRLPTAAQVEFVRLASDMARRFACTEQQAREFIVFNRPPCSASPGTRTERRKGASAKALRQHRLVRAIKARRPSAKWAEILAQLPSMARSSTVRHLQRDYERTQDTLLRLEAARAAADEVNADTTRRARVALKYDLSPMIRLGLGLPLRRRRTSASGVHSAAG
jgi:hypothetical protein